MSLGSIGVGLGALAQGFDSQQAADMQRQLQQFSLASNQADQLRQLGEAAMASGNNQLAAQYLPGYFQKLSQATGQHLAGPGILGQTQQVEGAMPAGQFGPGLPTQQTVYDDPKTTNALLAAFGSTPQTEVIHGSYGTPSQAVRYNPITGQIETIWQGQDSPRDVVYGAQANLDNARANGIASGLGPNGMGFNDRPVNLGHGVMWDPSTQQYITAPGGGYDAAATTKALTPLQRSELLSNVVKLSYEQPGLAKTTNETYGQPDPAMQAKRAQWQQNWLQQNGYDQYGNPVQQSPSAQGGGSASPSASVPQGVSQWSGLIDMAAQKYHVDPQILERIMSHESGGNMAARGSAGEIGAMQVLPSTGTMLGYSSEQLANPYYNIDAAAKLLAMNLKQYKGDVHQAVRAYNGTGPQADQYATDVLSGYGGNGLYPQQAPASNQPAPKQSTSAPYGATPRAQQFLKQMKVKK